MGRTEKVEVGKECKRIKIFGEKHMLKVSVHADFRAGACP
jgi:hypothetical protein